MPNNELEDNLHSIITQFKNLGLNLNLNEEDIFSLKSHALQMIDPKKNKPYSSNIGNPLIYYLFEPHEDSRSKKSVLLLGGIHPDEIAPLYTTWKLLTDYLKLKDPSIIKNQIILQDKLIHFDAILGLRLFQHHRNAA